MATLLAFPDSARCGWSPTATSTAIPAPLSRDRSSVPGDSGVVLELGAGIGAVEFPAGRGRDVLALLPGRGVFEPVLALPGRQLRWIVAPPGGALPRLSVVVAAGRQAVTLR